MPKLSFLQKDEKPFDPLLITSLGAPIYVGGLLYAISSGLMYVRGYIDGISGTISAFAWLLGLAHVVFYSIPFVIFAWLNANRLKAQGRRSLARILHQVLAAHIFLAITLLSVFVLSSSLFDDVSSSYDDWYSFFDLVEVFSQIASIVVSIFVILRLRTYHRLSLLGPEMTEPHIKEPISTVALAMFSALAGVGGALYIGGTIVLYVVGGFEGMTQGVTMCLIGIAFILISTVLLIIALTLTTHRLRSLGLTSALPVVQQMIVAILLLAELVVRNAVLLYVQLNFYDPIASSTAVGIIRWVMYISSEISCVVVPAFLIFCLVRYHRRITRKV